MPGALHPAMAVSLWWVAVIAGSMLAMVAAVFAAERHRTAPPTRGRLRRRLNIPHHAGRIIPFPSYPVRVWFRYRARRHQDLHRTKRGLSRRRREGNRGLPQYPTG